MRGPHACFRGLGSLLGGQNLFWGLFGGSGASFWGCVRAVLEVVGPVLGALGPYLRGFLGVAGSFLGSKAILGGRACFGAWRPDLGAIGGPQAHFGV